jgi:hypothetical protein
MYCWNCGHKNADDNKFCGECGKTLLVPDVPPARHSAPINTVRTDSLKTHENTKPEPVEPDLQKTEAGMRPAENPVVPRTSAKLTNPLVEEPRVVRERLSPVQTAEEPRPVPEASPIESFARDFGDVSPRFSQQRVSSVSPNAAAISSNRIHGPSFLGLSDEPRLADDSSYLLEDEENSSSWRGYLALAFLLIIGVLVLRQWTEMRGIASDFAQRLGIGDTSKRVKAQPTVSPSSEQPGQNPSGATSTAGESANPTSTPNGNGNANSTSPNQEVAKAKPSDSLAGGKPENDADSHDSSDSSKTESAKNATAKGKAKEESTEEEDGATAESAKGGAKPSTKSTATAAATYDNSQVDLAQRYLQGKGVPQDCNRGVSLLRSAARQANPKARIQMAALYLSGHCVEQNLPQAYSWFAQAQELEPNNAWIERNLNSLWAKMTDEERRRVLR